MLRINIAPLNLRVSVRFPNTPKQSLLSLSVSIALVDRFCSFSRALRA